MENAIESRAGPVPGTVAAPSSSGVAHAKRRRIVPIALTAPVFALGKPEHVAALRAWREAVSFESAEEPKGHSTDPPLPHRAWAPAAKSFGDEELRAAKELAEQPLPALMAPENLHRIDEDYMRSLFIPTVGADDPVADDVSSLIGSFIVEEQEELTEQQKKDEIIGWLASRYVMERGRKQLTDWNAPLPKQTATFVQNIHNNFTTNINANITVLNGVPAAAASTSTLEMSPFERMFDEVIPKRKYPVLTLASSSYTIWEGATIAHIVHNVLQRMREGGKKRVKRQSRGVASIQQWRDWNDPRKSDIERALLRALAKRPAETGAGEVGLPKDKRSRLSEGQHARHMPPSSGP